MAQKITFRVYSKSDPLGRALVSVAGLRFEFTRVLVRHASGPWGDVHINGSRDNGRGMLAELRWCYGIEVDFDMDRVLAALDKSVEMYAADKSAYESREALRERVSA